MKNVSILLTFMVCLVLLSNKASCSNDYGEKPLNTKELEINKESNQQRVIVAFRGRAHDLGGSNGVWTIWCQPSSLKCVEIVEEGDGSWWAYIYLNSVQYTPINEYNTEGEYVYLNIGD